MNIDKLLQKYMIMGIKQGCREKQDFTLTKCIRGGQQNESFFDAFVIPQQVLELKSEAQFCVPLTVWALRGCFLLLHHMNLLWNFSKVACFASMLAGKIVALPNDFLLLTFQCFEFCAKSKKAHSRCFWRMSVFLFDVLCFQWCYLVQTQRQD